MTKPYKLVNKDGKPITEREWVDPPFIGDVDKLERQRFYIIDEWAMNEYWLRIMGFYSYDGSLQTTLFVADENGKPIGEPKSEEKAIILFNRMCDLIGIPRGIPEEGLELNGEINNSASSES